MQPFVLPTKVYTAKYRDTTTCMCTACNSKAAVIYIAMDFKLAVNNNCVSWGLNRETPYEIFYGI